jgi:ABC-type Fe3+-hydroxamate transport system substrate-binding protein
LEYWPKIEAETLMTLNPDVVIVIGSDTSSKRIEISKHQVWSKLKAVKSNNIIFLNSASAFSTSHYFADAVAELANKLGALK